MSKKYMYATVGAIAVIILLLGIFIALNNNKTSAPVAEKNTVVVQQSAFSPSTITVAKGSAVTWRNDDSYVHRIVADDNSFDLGDQARSATVSHMFTKAGTYTYHCSVHPFMKGTVVVQ